MFAAIAQFVYGWLPTGLWLPVYAVISCAALIITVKVLIALVQIISKAILLFI